MGLVYSQAVELFATRYGEVKSHMELKRKLHVELSYPLRLLNTINHICLSKSMD